jgi:hypothetical protein
MDKGGRMFNKKYLWILILFITPLLSASYGTYKQNECINLIQTCSNCTYINVSNVLYPNSSIAITETPMTKSGKSYNLTFCNTDSIGTYIVNGFGDVDGEDTVWAYDFKISKTGYEVSNSQIILTLIITGLIFLIALMFFIFGLKIENIGVKVFSLSFTVILMVFLIGYLSTIINNFLTEFTFITDSFTPLYIIFITLLSVGGIGLILFLIYIAFDMFYKYRGLKLQ